MQQGALRAALEVRIAQEDQLKLTVKLGLIEIENAQTLAETLRKYGYKLQTDGSDNHIVLLDLRPLKLTGSKVEKVCDLLGITINSTSVLYLLSDVHSRVSII